jgi:transcriptional regulator with XRE-family HTH domain
VTDQQESTVFNHRLGANIQRFRKAAGISQATLAKDMVERGFSFQQPMIGKIERGERELRIRELVTLSEILGVELALLLDRGEVQTAAAMAQLRTATAGMARCDRQIAELKDQKEQYRAMAAEAVERLGGTEDDEGRYVWEAPDGSRAMHIPEGAPLLPESVTRPPTTKEERRERAIANLRADAALPADG